MILWTILVVLIVAIDQISKYLVVTNIGGSDLITIIPGVIDFVYVQNTGAAFSILENNVELLSVISGIFCIGVLVYMFTQRPKNNLLRIAMAFLFGGAVGNVIDRIFRGYVVDFIETTFIKFPVFNVADIAITIGAVLLILYILFFEKKDQEIKETTGPEVEEDGAGNTDSPEA